jgi:hypothetical protein
MPVQYINSAFLSKWVGPLRDSNRWPAPCWVAISSRESRGSPRPRCAPRGRSASARRHLERTGAIS